MMQYELELLVVLGLVTWRLTSMLTKESGPYDIFGRLRDAVGIHYDELSNCVGGPVSGMLCCFWCTSVWIAVILMTIVGVQVHFSVQHIVALALAISTVAIIITKVID